MTLQTTNAVMLIRCFTKYLIEIENEAALLEQINFKAISSLTDSQAPSMYLINSSLKSFKQK